MNLDILTAEMICKLRELFCDFTWRAAWAFIASVGSWLIGETGEPVMALAALYVLDFALGFTLAWRDSTLSRDKFRGGIFKFLLYALVLITANLFDRALGQVPFFEHPVRVLLVCYLAAGEFLSICAHVSELNPNILPKGLLDRVRKYRSGLFACREEASR